MTWDLCEQKNCNKHFIELLYIAGTYVFCRGFRQKS